MRMNKAKPARYARYSPKDCGFNELDDQQQRGKQRQQGRQHEHDSNHTAKPRWIGRKTRSSEQRIGFDDSDHLIAQLLDSHQRPVWFPVFRG
jgi:hypothetical protein